MSRRGAILAYGAIALACAISVWPIVASGSVPAFQQDWAWPLSRPLAFEWLKSFLGLWDGRSTAHANLLPWQTYAVLVQTLLVTIFGASFALAVWIAALEFLAAVCCTAMLGAFGVTSWPARLTAAAFYALGPVVFTRIAAGHLAYLLGYALLPLAIALASRAIERRDATSVVALGVTVGLAGSQIQFLAIAWLAIVPLPLVLERARGWPWRLVAAAGIAVTVQLQALLPLAFGSAASLYAAQPPLLAFEYNNSAPPDAAAVMLGYFTRYFETHAPSTEFAGLYVLLIVALSLAMLAGRRSCVPAIFLIVSGGVLTAGLYGPLSGLLGWTFEHVTYAEAFRDLHYFAVLTAAGVALGLGAGLQRLPVAFSFATLLLVAFIAAPVVGASELREIVVPRAYVDDALADMRSAVAHGPGRVLWLPAEEPLGPIGASNSGRDFTAYGPGSNPSVSDDYQNPQLAYAMARLRIGNPDWNSLAELNVRYLVVRNYVRSQRQLTFGIAFPMAFAGLSDGAIARAIARSPSVRLLQQSSLSSVYAVDANDGFTYTASGNRGAMTYSELRHREVALAPESGRLRLQASRESPDPHAGWVEGMLGWRYAPWLPDSIYPFLWTLSRTPLPLGRASACVFAGALPHGATLRAGVTTLTARGTWKGYHLGAPLSEVSFLPTGGDVSAIAQQVCVPAQPPSAAFVFSGGYDPGWRALEGGGLMAPTLANGWMMAWDAHAATSRLLYLPAFLQLVGFVILGVVLAVSLGVVLRARRASFPRA